MDDLLSLLLYLTIWGLVIGLIVRAGRRSRRMWKLISELRRTRPLFIYWDVRYQPINISLDQRPPRSKACLLAVTNEQIKVYPKPYNLDQFTSFPFTNLRWFGRPHKYSYGLNEIWLHFEMGERWVLLKLWLHRGGMQELVRALKTAATAEQVMAYRRRRPYIHAGPLPAQPASQDIHGAWTLDEPVELYLNPAFLVILRQGVVLRALPLESIQQIAALRRLDAPETDGLVRFQFTGEPFAFALPQHERLAAALAEAAKRTLEAPIIRKGKEKGVDDEDDYDEDEPLVEEVVVGDFIIGDDGELHARDL